MFMALSPCERSGSPSGDESPAAPQRLDVHALDDPRRPEVEDFIRRIYQQRFGASVRQFAPVLVSLRDADGIAAAAGYRHAAQAPLFLERYLAAPVETLLAQQAGARASRDTIVEVGHLAAVRSEGRRLILMLGPHLAARGFEWVVSTLTEELRRLFLRIGVTPLALGRADPAALGDEAADWGSYYDHRPMVLAGHIWQALRHPSRGSAAARRHA
jgi:hypothetical protein